MTQQPSTEQLDLFASKIEDQVDIKPLTILEQHQAALATRLNISLAQYKKLASTLQSDKLSICVELLGAKKHNVPFRRWADTTLRAWLESDEVRYFPLTNTQLDRLKPRWPPKFQIPVA